MTSAYDPSIKKFLPHEKMYTLQLGTERFVLSGASLSSDAPSYFTNYFSNSANADKVLYIDRSPDVFKLIYSHLQGYYLDIWDADMFTKVFIDSLYYNLPKLRAMILDSEYFFANVSGESFKIPKQVLTSPGNSPNFFTLGNQVLYKDISQIIVNMNWIRPPPQAAPTLNRCPLLLKELLGILQGIEIEITSDLHRRTLIKEARYYRFNALVQRLVKHKIIYNPFLKQEEIIVSLDYLNAKDLIVHFINGGFITYKRSHVDQEPRVLIIETEDTDMMIQDGQLTAFNNTAKKLSTVFGKWKNGTNDDGSFSLPVQVNDWCPTSITIDGKVDKAFEWDNITRVLKAMFKVNVTLDESDGPGLNVQLVKADVVTKERSFYDSISYV